MEDITDADYAHRKRICKDPKAKTLEEYHDLYVQSNTLLLADIFENFWNMCLEIYELDPVRFFLLHQYYYGNRSFSWYRYITNDKKSYQSRNVSHNSSICKS